MPHCQKEFSKPPQSSKKKKEEQKAKKDAAKAKAAKKAAEDDESEHEREAELAAEKKEAEKKEAEARKLRDAKAKGTEAFKDGNLAEAISCYSECIELDPADHIHWSNRAACRQKLGHYEEALSDSKKCVELNPEFVKGWARLGAANVGLGNFEAAEEALQHGLTLEPDNAPCVEGLKDLEKAKEPTVEDIFDALVKQLKVLEPDQLRARALDEGIHEVKIEEAELSEDPKEGLVSLITAHKYLVYLVTEELQDLDLAQLRARALEEGLSEEKVTEAENQEEPTNALTSLIIKYLCDDLVDVATEVQAEAAEAEESDDEEEELDIEFVDDMDAEDLQLAEGDVFLAGAYVDQEYGELVLPSGVKLGNRALSRYYRQRSRPNKERQLALPSISRLHANIMKREERRKQFSLAAKGSNTSSSTAKHVFKHAPDNKAMRAIVHHWGAGGGGAHYWGAGGKQYNKGNKVKGVILRHSRQGAKLQSARNKQNRGSGSVACLQ